MSNDIETAKRYIAKAQSAAARGIIFELPFTSYRNLMRAKRCRYTGIELTEHDGNAVRPTDRTIDRVDNTKGYVVGNVVACCQAANNAKSAWENPANPLTPEAVLSIIGITEELKTHE